ncbi:hypothetical protein AVEN_93953-1 [Araneus ventricosus]|uniref:Uncharacterized protein n=1 Tax=Araneus ventricosus TaxID=182803 RepID=A0A4Y2CK64_ARAVE|nr:hypothetical protein AVEN_93953-1 [Araneus ventricosus]
MEKVGRCEPESETVEEVNNFIHSNEDVEDQGDFSFSSIFKHKEDGNSSKPIESANNISGTDVPKMEIKQECDSFKYREENPLPGVVKSRSNSVLKSTHGFQLILNEAKKQMTDLNYDLDW